MVKQGEMPAWPVRRRWHEALLQLELLPGRFRHGFEPVQPGERISVSEQWKMDPLLMGDARSIKRCKGE